MTTNGQTIINIDADNICDRACKNLPCECKKSPIFSVFAVS